jgi:hypothetical protein
LGRDGWYYGADQSRIQGYGARNFMTRMAVCRTARKVFRATRRIQADSQAEYLYKATRLRAAGRRWRCVDVRPGYESSDMRCTARGHRVVRWQEAV